MMTPSLIVGTAGHIDHGKTALVRALTGVNTDRLPEEQRRGMTIDLGFAHLTRKGRRFAFIDVPGHERFIKNMLAGAHGLDLVLLVVAADEGVMPQTVEHLAICRLLGLTRGVVALTKRDLVTAEWLALVQEDVARLTADTFLADKPIVPVSAKTGEGVDDLLDALEVEAALVSVRDATRPPRLPIDRVFTKRGFGVVATGTLIAGTFRVGDEVGVEPGGLTARIRGIEVHGEAREVVRAGERAALNLGGLAVADLRRGQVIVPARCFQPTSLLDVRLELLPDAPQPLPQNARVRFHHGTSEGMARVTLLDGGRELPPGDACFAQLRLEAPILALPGDCFIVRRPSPPATIGGGRILDAHPPRRRGRLRAAADFLSRLDADPDHRRLAFVERAGANGLTLEELAGLTGDADAELEAFARRTVGCVYLTATRRLVSKGALDALAQTILDALAATHRERLLQPDLPREDIRNRVARNAPPEVFQYAVAQLVQRGNIIADARAMRLATHRVQLSEEETALKDRVERVCRAAGAQPPTIEEIGRATGLALAQAQASVAALLAEQRILRVADFLLHAEVAAEIVARVRQAKSPGEKVEVGDFKAMFNLPRKYAIPLLEWLDQIGVTRRYGDKRIVV
ncbi:MAG: selenocysteine-specific translation elongation factor [Chloracidobacterium sp.]|nr:selenocysteine-specific translation elongation factor [Chloracidobacterium sp.]MDW8218875.1 selenocysteine-specific translation elongation factor [Acidobacteriota bacterium]